MSAFSENGLPAHWKTVGLGDLCRTTSGGTPSRKNPNFFAGNIPWVKSGELPDGPVVGIEEFISEEAVSNSSAKIFPAGTLLVAMYGATVGKLGILKCDAATNQAVCAIFPPEEVDTKFLFWYLRSVREELISQAVGGAQPNISQGILRELVIPLAPLNEQSRIVAEIEKQFSRLDEAVGNLKRVKANLKRYKAAVLKAAVEGKLTEEWRQQHPDVEPADKLLERILVERRKAVGKGKYKEPVAPDTSGLPELPVGWVWASVGTIAFVTKLAGFEYTKFVKYDPDGDLNVIKAENAGREGFKWTDFSRIKSETVSQLTRSKLKAGDLLMVFVGAGTGNVARVPDDRSYFLGPNIAMMRVGSSQVIPGYVEHFLRSPVGNSLALGYAKAVAQPSLSMETIRLIPLALPPLSEQHQIVAEVERRLSIVAEAETEVDNNLRRADRLRQSILKQAFSGQLVPQDPNDEPASMLLERIGNDVGARHAVPKTQSERPKRAQHAVPLRISEPAPAASPSLNAVLNAILGRMQPSKEYSRADLADPLGLSTGRWNAAIQELKRRGQVRQVGEKRGARYVAIKERREG